MNYNDEETPKLNLGKENFPNDFLVYMQVDIWGNKKNILQSNLITCISLAYSYL